MGLVLIVVGLAISYLCWVQKGEIDYIERKNHENAIGTESIIGKRKNIEIKLLNNEKLTILEGLNWYSYKIMFAILKFGFYGGFVLSLIGLILFVSNKF
jgi:hypothetical protein